MTEKQETQLWIWCLLFIITVLLYDNTETLWIRFAVIPAIWLWINIIIRLYRLAFEIVPKAIADKILEKKWKNIIGSYYAKRKNRKDYWDLPDNL